MKKLFQIIGMITLICFSFFYTEKTVKVVKEYDNIMIEIRSKEKEYYSEAIDAIIIKDTIIPGVKGLMIDADKSYSNMKRYGKFEESLLVFKTIKPDISIDDNLKKYVVGGNTSKKEVALIFLIKDNNYIDKIIDILDEKDVLANFFFEGSLIESNKELIKELIYKEHNIGNLGFNGSYNNSSYTWTNVFIKKLQKTSYCYLEQENSETLDICTLNKNRTIIPSIKLSNSINNKFKEKLKNGSLIAIETNDITIKELPVLINYIKSKGYKIQNLSTLLTE